MSRKLIHLCLFVGLFVAAVLVVAAAAPVAASPDAAAGSQDAPPNRPDDLPHPLGDAQRAARQEALIAKVQGKAQGKTHPIAQGQYVELERAGEDSIWTVLGEFADFAHNNIAEPDRSNDNTTYWVPDFTREHYMDMLFSEAAGDLSMRNFYIEQSSNRYTVNGDVTDWVSVPGGAATYDDDLGGGAVWQFLEDSVDGWYANQLAAGMSADEINDYLSQFDVWDRYDWDGDGNFNEPDGYIDHFQSVHAGEGEEAGGGALGSTAIWSHRWYARFNLIGSEGPSADYLLGGIQIGDSGYWIGDYTIEPENGGVGVFAHEFAHDLGLPDLYATAGGGENSTGFWTLMSSGSWMTGSPDNIGTKPTHMGAWEKFQLGWLNYDVAVAGNRSTHRLGPVETNSKQAQGLFVLLPDKEVNTQIADPYAGEHFYYSGAGNNLDHVMYREFALGAGASLSAWVNYDIEVDWDYAYVVVSTDGGASWTPVETNHSTTTDPHGQNFGFGITGDSGGWTELTADLSAYAGQTVLAGFRYWTDVAAVEPGFMADEIVINGEGPFGAEADEGWTLDGFRITTGAETSFHFNAYVAEYRQYWGYDDALRTGPYNFTGANWVEHFPYQDGLLLSYWDSSQSNNNTPQHHGEGLILPIDAHPEALIRSDGAAWRNRMQSYDSTFTKEATDEITLHWDGVATTHGGAPGVDLFDDNIQYWNPDIPTAGVKNPHTGTQIWIQSISTQGNFMQVQVRPSQ